METSAEAGSGPAQHCASSTRRALPDAIRSAIDLLIDEYAKLESSRSDWKLQELMLHQQIDALNAGREQAARARQILVSRITMLEYALRKQAADRLHLPTERSIDNVENQRPGPQPPFHPSSRSTDQVNNKYKTLPSNFLSRSSAGGMSPGQRMLWEYLEELGYMPESKGSERVSSRSQPALQFTGRPAATSSTTGIGTTAELGRASISVDVNKGSDLSRVDLRDVFSPPASAAPAISPVSIPPVMLPSPALQNSVASKSHSDATTPVAGPSSNTHEEETPELSSVAIEFESSGSGGVTTPGQWRPKMTLLNHLDAVRQVDFHDTLPFLASASEDGTLKLWDLSPERGAKRGQPCVTLFGHSCPLLSVSLSDTFCAAGDVSGQVRLWDVSAYTPTNGTFSSTSDQYDPLGNAFKYRRASLREHTDAVWGVVLASTTSLSDPLVYSCSADGTAHCYSTALPKVDAVQEPLIRFARNSSAVSPCTSLSTTADRLLVSYADGQLVTFDRSTGQQIQSIQLTTRLTRCVTHSAHSTIVFTAGVDHTITLVDLNSSQCIHRILAHTQAVTALSISPDGQSMVSACHDSSIRFWDIGKRVCVQDLSAHQTHRRKYHEAIHSVTYHPQLGFTASAGADCAIKVYQS